MQYMTCPVCFGPGALRRKEPKMTEVMGHYEIASTLHKIMNHSEALRAQVAGWQQRVEISELALRDIANRPERVVQEDLEGLYFSATQIAARAIVDIEALDIVSKDNK